MSGFFYRLRRVKWKFIKEVWKLPISLVSAPFYKMNHKDLWIVCEDENEARDNGYWFFKYVRENHPTQECVYAIHKSSFDFDKVRKLGRTVEFGSLKHWIMYLASTKKISSQKAGNPNAAIFYFLEVYGILKDKRIFLQHGVIKDDLTWLHYDVTKMMRILFLVVASMLVEEAKKSNMLKQCFMLHTEKKYLKKSDYLMKAS